MTTTETGVCFSSLDHLLSAIAYVPDNSNRSKMSKSSGTAVSVDHVVRGVCWTSPGFYFAAPYLDGDEILLHPIPAGMLNIWRDQSGQYRTGPPYGEFPVFLMRDGIDVPCWFSDIEDYQHPGHPYWFC